MPTLAEQLGETTPSSLLIRKASRLGVKGLDTAICTAVSRGCRHYAAPFHSSFIPPSRDLLPDDELTILLLSGEHPYQPTAIRCAAQLARSIHVDAERLARLANRFKSHRVLAHIARAGIVHDSEGVAFWQTVLSALPQTAERQEPDLPHWSRFVSMPGFQRHGMATSRWLTPVL